MTGIRPAVPDTVLIARARAALAAGPLDAGTLLGHVLALPGAPPRVASRLARALLGSYPEFACDAADHWTLLAPARGALLTEGVSTARVTVRRGRRGDDRQQRPTLVTVSPRSRSSRWMTVSWVTRSWRW
jgi:hypothetical protein